MAEQYEITQAIAHMRVARYLATKADSRGMTHGEKHFLLQVALQEMCRALILLGETDWSVVHQTSDDDPIHLLWTSEGKY